MSEVELNFKLSDKKSRPGHYLSVLKGNKKRLMVQVSIKIDGDQRQISPAWCNEDIKNIYDKFISRYLVGKQLKLVK